MARFETWTVSDLKKPVTVQPLHGEFFSADAGANIIGVEVLDNGAAASLTGTVTGYIVRADGATVSQSGTLSGNKASITLPASAYAVDGPVDISIKLTASGVITTLASFRGYVRRATTDTIVDSGSVITLVASVNGVLPDENGALTLAASDITSGTFAAARIPNLNASKITAGTIGAARLPNMVGASSSNDGTKGAVPAPSAGDQNKLLRGDGTWVATANPTSGSSAPASAGGVYSGLSEKVNKAGDAMTGDLSATNMTVNGTTNPSFYIDNANGTAVRILTRGSNGLRFRLITTPGTAGVYEDYRLPIPTISSGSTPYEILTTKESVVNKYAAGDSFATASNYAVPFIGYVNANGTIINFTVPIDKDISGISSVAVDRWAGAIRTAAGEFIAGQSGSSFNWLTLSGVTVTATKVGNALVRVSMTFTTKPTNATENTPVVGAMLATFTFA